MNPGYGGPDSGYGDNGYSRSYGSPGMNYGPGGGGLMGEYNGGRMGDKPYMGTPSRKVGWFLLSHKIFLSYDVAVIQCHNVMS